jgi:hypothetical protein
MGISIPYLFEMGTPVSYLFVMNVDGIGTQQQYESCGVPQLAVAPPFHGAALLLPVIPFYSIVVHILYVLWLLSESIMFSGWEHVAEQSSKVWIGSGACKIIRAGYSCY